MVSRHLSTHTETANKIKFNSKHFIVLHCNKKCLKIMDTIRTVCTMVEEYETKKKCKTKFVKRKETCLNRYLFFFLYIFTPLRK